MNNTPTVLSNQSLTNSQDPKWVAAGLAYWTNRQPTEYTTRRRIQTEVEMFTYWAKALGLDNCSPSCTHNDPR